MQRSQPLHNRITGFLVTSVARRGCSLQLCACLCMCVSRHDTLTRTEDEHWTVGPAMGRRHQAALRVSRGQTTSCSLAHPARRRPSGGAAGFPSAELLNTLCLNELRPLRGCYEMVYFCNEPFCSSRFYITKGRHHDEGG